MYYLSSVRVSYINYFQVLCLYVLNKRDICSMCLGSVYRCTRMLWCRCSLQHCSTLDKPKTVKLFIIKMVRVAGD